jgi:hypothetical protein
LKLGVTGSVNVESDGPMIYIEFTTRRPQPGVREDERGALALESFESQLERFHRAVLAGQSGWENGWSEDELVMSIGRTWRLGPEPEYLTIWHTPAAGLARLDEWDRVFRSGEADALEKPFRELARIERAGCYEALLPPVRASSSIYYAEFFEPTGTNDEIRTLYAHRAVQHPTLTLALCGTRIGKLAPDPGGIAIWTLPSYGALAEIARGLDTLSKPVRLETAGVYNDLGKEIL